MTNIDGGIRLLIKGRACAGKDTAADYLVKNYNFTKLAFADGIYDIAERYFGMRVKDRRLLQRIGQSMRGIDPNVWIKETFRRAEGLPYVVISDTRQANEYMMGVANGFLPIEIVAPLSVRIERSRQRDGIEPDVSLWENDSETGADNFQYHTIDNGGTPGNLFDKLDDILIQYSIGKLWTPTVG